MVRKVATSPLIEHGRGARLAPGLEVVADLLYRTDQRDVLDHGGGDGRRRVVLAPVEVGVLDLVWPPPRSPCGRRRRSGSSSPWRPCRRCRARGTGRNPSAAASVSSLITVGAKASTSKSAALRRAARPGEALVEGGLEGGHRLGGEEDGEPAVGDLRGQGDVLRALGPQDDRDVGPQRVHDRLERLAQAGAARIGQRVVRARRWSRASRGRGPGARRRRTRGCGPGGRGRAGRTSPRPPGVPRRRGRARNARPRGGPSSARPWPWRSACAPRAGTATCRGGPARCVIPTRPAASARRSRRTPPSRRSRSRGGRPPSRAPPRWEAGPSPSSPAAGRSSSSSRVAPLVRSAASVSDLRGRSPRRTSAPRPGGPRAPRRRACPAATSTNIHGAQTKSVTPASTKRRYRSTSGRSLSDR